MDRARGIVEESSRPPQPRRAGFARAAGGEESASTARGGLCLRARHARAAGRLIPVSPFKRARTAGRARARTGAIGYRVSQHRASCSTQACLVARRFSDALQLARSAFFGRVRATAWRRAGRASFPPAPLPPPSRRQRAVAAARASRAAERQPTSRKMQLAGDFCRSFPGRFSDATAAEAAALCARHGCYSLAHLQGCGGETAGWSDWADASAECRRLVRMAALARPPPGPPPGRDAETGILSGA